MDIKLLIQSIIFQRAGGRKEEKRFAMDGRRVSSLSVGSNESEGSGGTRVGQIFYIPLIFLFPVQCAELVSLVNKILFVLA